MCVSLVINTLCGSLLYEIETRVNRTLSRRLVSADVEMVLLVIPSSGFPDKMCTSHKSYAGTKGCILQSYKCSWLKVLSVFIYLQLLRKNHKISSWSLRPWKIRPIYCSRNVGNLRPWFGRYLGLPVLKVEVLTA